MTPSFYSANIVINNLKCIRKGKISNLTIKYFAPSVSFEKRICHFAACKLMITRELLGSFVMIVIL